LFILSDGPPLITGTQYEPLTSSCVHTNTQDRKITPQTVHIDTDKTCNTGKGINKHI